MLKKKFKVKYMVAKQMFGAKQKNNIFKCLGVGWVIFHWEGEDLFRLPPPPLNNPHFCCGVRLFFFSWVWLGGGGWGGSGA